MLLTARQAADRLGIKLDTLYAYVSRGRLRSVGVPGTRQRRYRAEEVEALRGDGTTPRSADSEALMPVIGSSICLIENGKLYYRGQDASALAASATLEDIAALLWRADPAQPSTDGCDTHSSPDVTLPSQVIARCQIRLAQLADQDLPALDLTRAGVIRTGWRILHELAACLTPTRLEPAPIHRQLAAAWELNEAGADILRRCLVLIADHELNASTFVARCVASTHATPYAVVSAALAALSGRRHGGASAQVEALFEELAKGGDPPYRAISECRLRARCGGDRFGAAAEFGSRPVRRWPRGRVDRPRDRAVRKRNPDPSPRPLLRATAARGASISMISRRAGRARFGTGRQTARENED